jgi:vancomycin resistance protein YoaR
MYYRSNPPPQNRPPSGNQWGNIYQQGVRPTEFQNGGYPPVKPKKKRGFRWQLFKLLLVLLLVAAVGAGIYVGKAYLDVRPYTSVFLDGITVDGIALGGMTWEDGNEAVRNQIVEELGSWYVRLKSTNGMYRDITAETLNISRDPAGALEAAWAVGHETSADDRKTVFELQQEIQAALTNSYSFSSVSYDADTSQIDDILAVLENAAYIKPQDAYLVSFNPESSSEPFLFQSEVVGRRLDIDKLEAEILTRVGAFESGEILMQTEAVMPDVTVADLEKYYALRARAVTPIDAKSSEARNDNIRVAFAKISGKIINDGAKFSFNGYVGRRTLENGFFRAYEYNYGELTMGVGGGVCQASTTIYLAAMQAGMDLIDHTPHAMKVSYTELGLDATVTDTRGAEKDMSFRNNSGGQIFISAHVIKDPANSKRLMCEVRIYGMSLGDTTYALSTETVEVLQPPVEPVYIEDVDSTYVTFTDETKDISEATVGYVVDTYRDTYVNGVLMEHKKLTRSTYPAYPKKIWVGTIQR